MMNKTIKTLFWAAWIVFAVFGLYGLWIRIETGKELTNYSSYVPWGLWVSGYIYFIGLSAGAFVLSSLVYVFRIEKLAKVGRVALFTAAITLGMALFSIWMDLGHMWRFYEIFTRPNFHSMMAWMVWLYSAYFLLILVELWIEMRCDLATLARKEGPFRWLYKILLFGWNCPEDVDGLSCCRQKSKDILRVLGSLGVPLAIAFHGGVGALFATLTARPFWHQSLFPVLFLTGALVSGGALLLFLITVLAPKEDRSIDRLLPTLGKMVLGVLFLDIILEWAETTIPIWYGVGPEVELFKEILFGEFWYIFWIVHILLGTLIPIYLLIRNRGQRWRYGLAGILIASTFLAVRLNLVVPGLVTPGLEGLQEAFKDPRLHFDYIPSIYEWGVSSLILAGGMALFFIGRRILPLDGVKDDQPVLEGEK
jgi:Ni/Fe-hydrogenase subunit HybB-like protein